MSEAPRSAASPGGSDLHLSPDESKLVTLARGARARASAAEGAAVVDDIGRTYAAGAVDLAALKLTAAQAVVAAAVSSGSRRIVTAVVVGARPGLPDDDLALLAELGAQRVLAAGPDDALRELLGG